MRTSKRLRSGNVSRPPARGPDMCPSLRRKRPFLQALKAALRPDALIVVDAKPYYTMDLKKDVSYLKKCGTTHEATKALMDVIAEVKSFHIGVHRTLGNTDFKRPIGPAELGKYLSKGDDAATLDQRRSEAMGLLCKIEAYLKDHRSNEVPVTDAQHARFMRGLARWHLENEGLYPQPFPYAGDLLNFYSVLGQPSPLLVVQDTVLNRKANSENCAKHRKAHKDAEMRALDLIRKWLKPEAKHKFVTTYEGSVWKLLHQMKVERIAPPVKKLLTDSVLHRYAYSREVCYQMGALNNHKYRKMPVMLRDVHRVADALTQLMK